MSEPGHPGRSYQVMARRADDLHVGPDEFQERAPRKEGSWWPEWFAWLERHSGAPAALPSMGIPGEALLCAAPGTYVMQD